MSNKHSESAVMNPTREISIAHSPDSDDAFMFYGLATNKIRVPGYKFSHTLCDIETLNRRAQDEAFYDVTAISFHAYPYLQENYALMGCGGSVGEGYGPMIISLKPMSQDDLKRVKVAVPGTMTTAYLALKIFNPEIETEVVPFDQIIPEVLAGKYEAGLIIHEGQLTYGRSGLHKIIDLGVWWRETTKPGAASRRKRNPAFARSGVAQNHLQSTARQHSARARSSRTGAGIRHAVCARSGPTMASRFVSMYVNERTLDYGPDGREAIRKLLELGYERGIIPIAPRVEFRRLTDTAIQPGNRKPLIFLKQL